jgi:alkylation response protein AidB-like acyl-CoA dehydrogenase
MELEFTSDQDELRDSIRAVLAKECPISLVRAVVEGTGDTTRLWATMTDLGWPALTVPEEYDGIGLGAVESGILSEELGRAVAPGALLTTVTQFVPVVRALADTDQAERFLGAVAAGTCRGTVAITEPNGNVDPAATTVTAEHAGADHALSGRKRFVMNGGDVDEIAVVARHGDGLVVAIVPTTDARIEPVPTLDRSRSLVDVDLDGVVVEASRVLHDEGDIERALAEGTVGLALEMVGACQSIFDITLEYAKQREQFGVPIGSFQAVKHKLADMAVALERARATSYFAALTLAEADPRWRTATSVAKIAAGDCQRLLAKEGIQLHGGIGYTWEHDMHLYVKRVKAGEALFGTSAEHRARLGELLLAGG